MNRIGVVIVAHNSEREIGPCLDALPEGLDVVVVDNASADGTRGEVLRRPTARLIANPWNRGFAAAANQGIGALACDFALLLNPDVELMGGVEPLAAQCALPGVAAAGAKLIGKDGRPQAGFMVRRFPTPAALAFEVLGLNRLWPANPANRRYRCLDLDPEAEASVDQPAGALLMIRSDVWRQLGGFDESFYPVWFEDVDFARRAASAGYAMRYVPSIVAKHSGAHSIDQLERSTRDRCWYGNLLKYVAKHFARSGVVSVCLALVSGSIFRATFAVFRERRLEAVPRYGSIVRLALSLSFGRRAPDFSSALAVQ
jgi:GT2 family glycosyltransferase